eukprot:36287_1
MYGFHQKKKLSLFSWNLKMVWFNSKCMGDIYISCLLRIYDSLIRFSTVNNVTMFPKCKKKATPLSHIRKMQGNKHWSYDNIQLDLVLLWIKTGKTLLNQRKLLLNGMNEEDNQSRLSLIAIQSKIAKFVKGEFQSMNELLDN